MGRGRSKGGKREAGRKIWAEKPQECGATTRAARPPEWLTSPLEWGTRRGGVRSLEWRKTNRGPWGSRFTEIIAAEWRGVLNRSWNSKRSLVFAHVVLAKTLGIRRAREIRARITQRMDLWESGMHAGLVGDAEAEGAAR